jgi:ankyrin repeat protein
MTENKNHQQAAFEELTSYFMEQRKMLLESGCVNTSYLHNAVIHNEPTRVKILLDLKADINGLLQCQSALHLAVKYHHADMVKLLIEEKCRIDHPNTNRDTALFMGYRFGNDTEENRHPECMQLLLKHKADPNYVNSNRETPLYKAVRANNLKGVQILIQARADIHIAPEVHPENTILKVAQDVGHKEIYNVLKPLFDQDSSRLAPEKSPLVHEIKTKHAL